MTARFTQPLEAQNEARKKSPQNLNIAIVGGGIVGIVLALGLAKRDICVKIYEQARNFREIGAGVAFSATAQECMRRIDPTIWEALQRVGNKNVHSHSRYVDGYHRPAKDKNDTYEALLFEIPISDLGFWACHRAHFLEELVKLLPKGTAQLGKRLRTCTDEPTSNKTLLHFEDGETVEADAVIGCDGIKSRVRQLLFGSTHPLTASARYTHKVAYRAVLPMASAVSALGGSTDRAHNQCMHMGPHAHLLHYPLANYTLFNIVAFATDPAPWPEAERMTLPATKAQLQHAFAGWGPAVTALVDLMPDRLERWAIFDMYEHPAPAYARGRLCLAGDAAHASAPHHGAGAGFGMEDALALSMALEEAQLALAEESRNDDGAAGKLLAATFQAFSDERYERTQWLVRSSRETGDIYEWAYPGTGESAERCREEIMQRTRKLWDFDIAGMTERVRRGLGERLGKMVEEPKENGIIATETLNMGVTV